MVRTGADDDRPSVIPGPGGAPQPRYGWRGLMIDSARTVWSVEELCELLALMGRYRLNRLHWHLSDDAGWRLPVPGYPRLTEVAAQRAREPFEWYDNVDPHKRRAALADAPPDSSRGWYSEDDITRVLECAASNGIEVMPEIDLPGHMAAVIAAYPQFGDPALADLDPAQWTHRNDLLWPSDEVYAFLLAALDQIVALFDFPMVHLGGDECQYGLWEQDAGLMGRMAELGLHSGRDIQAHFIEHSRRHLHRHRRSVALWDEAAEVALAGDETIFGWRDGVGVATARASGHPWVYADASLLYFNRVAGPVDLEPAGMFGAIGVRDVLEAAPGTQDASLLGVQAAVWCEFIADRAALHYHLFPRLLALAELGWNGTSAWPDFEARLRCEVNWLAEHGVLGRPLDRHTASPRAVTPTASI